VAEEHHLPADVVASFDEHQESMVECAIHGLGSLGSADALAVKTAHTIRHIAEEGHVIIVGRGGQFLLAESDSAWHVRLIAPEQWRTEAYAKAASISDADALKAIRRLESDRVSYIKAHLNHSPRDPLAYDLILNMSQVSVDQAAEAIAAIVP
jgi:cytidylate kinase